MTNQRIRVILWSLDDPPEARPQITHFVVIQLDRNYRNCVVIQIYELRRNSDLRPWLRLELPLKSSRPRCFRREVELTHEFAKAAYLFHPAFIDEAKELMQSDPGLLVALELIAKRVLSRLPDGDVLPAVASVVKTVMDMQNRPGPYARPTTWASAKAKTAPHEWLRAWSNGHARRVGMVVLS